MTPLQKKRHRELELTLERAHEQRDDAIRRLVRCDGRLQMLMRQKARLEKAMAKLVPSPVPVSVAEGKLLDAAKPVTPEPVLNDAIPTFLQRSKEADAKDAAAVAAIKAEQAEQAKRKRLKKDAVPPSKKLGPDAKRMPLTGRAALAHIANR